MVGCHGWQSATAFAAPKRGSIELIYTSIAIDRHPADCLSLESYTSDSIDLSLQGYDFTSIGRLFCLESSQSILLGSLP